ncbi:hypothetical protein [uncultured Photobacterium sp.]|uniref:hypothetical protein n=1 Tax=uncultured Photobacterium sp. TaxID=173973 RepID=UPI0026064A9C|nr:hypothetical protein [uncultured Photobacterium sp.]
MKKLLSIVLFAMVLVFAFGGYAALDSHHVVAKKVTRAEAKSMGLNKTAYYMVYNTEDMARLDDQIKEKVEQRSVAYYSVVYFVPRRNKDHYQAMITEYNGKFE